MVISVAEVGIAYIFAAREPFFVVFALISYCNNWLASWIRRRTSWTDVRFQDCSLHTPVTPVELADTMRVGAEAAALVDRSHGFDEFNRRWTSSH